MNLWLCYLISIKSFAYKWQEMKKFQSPISVLPRLLKGTHRQDLLLEINLAMKKVSTPEHYALISTHAPFHIQPTMRTSPSCFHLPVPGMTNSMNNSYLYRGLVHDGPSFPHWDSPELENIDIPDLVMHSCTLRPSQNQNKTKYKQTKNFITKECIWVFVCVLRKGLSQLPRLPLNSHYSP